MPDVIHNRGESPVVSLEPRATLRLLAADDHPGVGELLYLFKNIQGHHLAVPVQPQNPVSRSRRSHECPVLNLDPGPEHGRIREIVVIPVRNLRQTAESLSTVEPRDIQVLSVV